MNKENKKILDIILSHWYNIIEKNNIIIPLNYPEEIQSLFYSEYEKNWVKYWKYDRINKGKNISQIILSKKNDSNNGTIYLELF